MISTVATNTGFNAGHSAVLILSALEAESLDAQHGDEPEPATYIGLDLGASEWSRGAAKFVNTSLFAGQLRVVYGDSRSTSSLAIADLMRTRLSEEAPEPACDLLSIDGDHTVPGVLHDWRAFSRHLTPGAVILFDDVDELHPVWAERGLDRIGCVSLSGVADDRPRALPMSATESFCVAVHQFSCVRYGVQCHYNTLGQELVIRPDPVQSPKMDE